MNNAELEVLSTDPLQPEQTWHPMGLVEHIPEPGDYLTGNIGDEPLVVIRDKNGEIRALSRVCRHRGFDMLDGEGHRGSDLRGARGNVKCLTCPYHAWTYDLEGQLLAAPVSNTMCNFDKSAIALPRFSIAVKGSVIFVSLRDSANELDEQLRAENIDIPRLAAH